MKMLWPLIKLWRAHRSLLLLGMLLSFLTLLAGIGLLSLSGWFISAAAFAGLTASTALAFNYFLPSAGVRLFALIRILSRYGERVVTHEATFRILSDLRVRFYTALEPLAPGYLARHHSGEMLTRMVSDIDALDNLYIRVLTPILVALGIMILVLCYVQFFNGILAGIMLGMLLITLLLIPFLLARLGKKPGQDQIHLTTQLRTRVVESTQGMADLLLLNRWQEASAQIEQDSYALLNTQLKMAVIQGLASALLLLLSGLTLWLVVYAAIPLVNTAHLNGANLALLALTALAAFEALAPITLAAQYWSKIKLAAQRLQDISLAKPEVVYPEQSPTLPTHHDVQLRDITFGYRPDQPVLTRFSLAISEGEHIALVGPTGIGKSTVIQLLARFFEPQQGEIQIGGIPIQRLSENDLRKMITVITQRPHLFSGTLRNNLLVANPNASDAECVHALQQVQLQEWFEQLPEGLDTWLGEGGTQLSGGQLRRLAVARAVLHRAPIWLLDEPTEGLDAETEAAFWQSLLPLMQDKTVLIISHQLARLPELNRVVKL